MEESSEHLQENQEQQKPERPLGLSLLLIFSFVYNGLLLVVMILGLFYPDIVQNILQQYYKSVYISTTTSFILTLAGTLVFGISFYGLLLLWMMKRKGFFYYTSAQVAMIITLVFILKSFDYVNIAIALLVIVIFALHTRKMT